MTGDDNNDNEKLARFMSACIMICLLALILIGTAKLVFMILGV